MSTNETELTKGRSFSEALDPHRRQSLLAAVEQVMADRQGEAPSVALIGWQAATLVDAVYEAASRVVILEDDPELVESIQQGLAGQQRGKKVTLIEQSPADVELDEPVDVAVSSVTSTWFIEGPAARLLENVRANVVKRKGTMIPRRFFHTFELASAPNDVGGLSLRVPRFSRPGEPVAVLSESKHFITTDFTEPGGVADRIDDTIIVKPLLGGRLTGLRLTSICELADGIVQVTSRSGLRSILVPLREDIHIEAGQPVSIHLSYAPGSGLEQTRFTARALPGEEPGSWEHEDHPVTRSFKDKITEMIELAKTRERGEDLAKVVDYTVDPHGDVSRLTAFFWTIDEEWRKPVREIVDDFRTAASSELGEVPSDETIYELMLAIYRDAFGD